MARYDKEIAQKVLTSKNLANRPQSSFLNSKKPFDGPETPNA
jgi:hypothetical protein